MKKPVKDKILTLRIPKELHDKILLRVHSERGRKNVSSWVRELILKEVG